MDHCANCGRELTPVFPEAPQRRADDYKQLEGALHIRLHGGYGEYIDHLMMGEPEYIICSSCAERFIAAHEFIKRDLDQRL